MKTAALSSSTAPVVSCRKTSVLLRLFRDVPEDAKMWNEYVARHSKATSDHSWEWRNILSKAFGFQPYYFSALVEGRLSEPITCTRPLALQGSRGLVGIKMIEDLSGLPCQTDFKPLSYDPVMDWSLVECTPKTGGPKQFHWSSHLVYYRLNINWSVKKVRTTDATNKNKNRLA